MVRQKNSNSHHRLSFLKLMAQGKSVEQAAGELGFALDIGYNFVTRIRNQAMSPSIEPIRFAAMRVLRNEGVYEAA